MCVTLRCSIHKNCIEPNTHIYCFPSVGQGLMSLPLIDLRNKWDFQAPSFPNVYLLAGLWRRAMFPWHVALAPVRITSKWELSNGLPRLCRSHGCSLKRPACQWSYMTGTTREDTSPRHCHGSANLSFICAVKRWIHSSGRAPRSGMLYIAQKYPKNTAVDFAPFLARATRWETHDRWVICGVAHALLSKKYLPLEI